MTKIKEGMREHSLFLFQKLTNIKNTYGKPYTISRHLWHVCLQPCQSLILCSHSMAYT